MIIASFSLGFWALAVTHEDYELHNIFSGFIKFCFKNYFCRNQKQFEFLYAVNDSELRSGHVSIKCFNLLFVSIFLFLSHCNTFSVCYPVIFMFSLIVQKQMVDVRTIHVMQFLSVCFRCPSLCTGHLAAWLMEVGNVLSKQSAALCRLSQ